MVEAIKVFLEQKKFSVMARPLEQSFCISLFDLRELFVLKQKEIDSIVLEFTETKKDNPKKGLVSSQTYNERLQSRAWKELVKAVIEC